MWIMYTTHGSQSSKTYCASRLKPYQCDTLLTMNYKVTPFGLVFGLLLISKLLANRCGQLTWSYPWVIHLSQSLLGHPNTLPWLAWSRPGWLLLVWSRPCWPSRPVSLSLDLDLDLEEKLNAYSSFIYHHLPDIRKTSAVLRFWCWSDNFLIYLL